MKNQKTKIVHIKSKGGEHLSYLVSERFQTDIKGSAMPPLENSSGKIVSTFITATADFRK